jgi:hypothetical protein
MYVCMYVCRMCSVCLFQQIRRLFRLAAVSVASNRRIFNGKQSGHDEIGSGRGQI